MGSVASVEAGHGTGGGGMTPTIDGIYYSFTQPICGKCYGVRQPHRTPSAIVPEFAEAEKCSDCGAETREGIYHRIDPTEVKHPSPERVA